MRHDAFGSDEKFEAALAALMPAAQNVSRWEIDERGNKIRRLTAVDGKTVAAAPA